MLWASTGVETKMMLYEASSCGYIRSVHKKTGKTRILSQFTHTGYKQVNIGDGVKTVHILVAMAHIPKPPEADDTWTIDHKNADDASNNDVSNLRWASKSQQTINQREISRGMIDGCPIVGINVRTGHVLKFPSASVAEEETDGQLHQRAISLCLNGKRKTHGGYVWTTPLILPDYSGEVWKKISHTPKYCILLSDFGRVGYEFKHGYIKKVSSNDKMTDRRIEETDSYPSVRINGKPRQLHILVWETFVGKIPKGMVVHHKNHDKRDARVSNLEMTTRPLNAIAAYDAGRFDGKKNAYKRMIIDGVIYKSETDAASALGVSRALISMYIKDESRPNYALFSS